MSGSQPVTLGTSAYVAIYPYEGGGYFIDGDNSGLLSVSTSKDITAPFGTFSMILAPGGPSGNSYPTWTQVLTPFSFVLIGLRRGNVSQVVMMGLITSCSESQVWSNGQVQRVTQVQGADIAYLFSNSSYYNLTYLFGNATGGLGGVGQLDARNAGLVQGTPASIGEAWYYDIMAGTNGIMSTLKFNKNGKLYPFSDVMQTWFQEYPYPIYIPMGSNFLAAEGTWLTKFLSFFQYPWYEFFVITAPQGYYPEAEGSDSQLSAAEVQLRQNAAQLDGYSDFGSLGNFVSADTFLVARVSPFPYARNTGTVASPIWKMYMDAWNALPRNANKSLGFLSSNMVFSNDGVRNFYLVNPITMSQLLGNSQASISAFMASNSAWVDIDSVNRYGYSPEITETEWFFDQNGIYAQKLAAEGLGQTDFLGLINDLTYRVMGEYLPNPLMASGSATFPMMPDMMPGTVFTYVPFKDGVTWDFYVQGVTHQYNFGGQNTTTLTLTRGLPSAIYADSSPSGLLTAIFTATAMKQGGTYQINVNAKGLKGITFADAPNIVTPWGQLQGGVQPTVP
jgi:hypothetical protein